MGTVKRLLVVLGCSLLLAAVTFGIALLPFDGGDWYGWVLFLAPFAGAIVGGWLVSRGRSTGIRAAWVVGGGLGIGLLGFWIEWFVLFQVFDALADDSDNGYYCC